MLGDRPTTRLKASQPRDLKGPHRVTNRGSIDAASASTTTDPKRASINPPITSSTPGAAICSTRTLSRANLRALASGSMSPAAPNAAATSGSEAHAADVALVRSVRANQVRVYGPGQQWIHRGEQETVRHKAVGRVDAIGGTRHAVVEVHVGREVDVRPTVTDVDDLRRPRPVAMAGHDL